MSIPVYMRENFNTMLRAARDGRLALVEATEDVDGITQPVYALCAVNVDGEEYALVPLGKLYDPVSENAYELLTPPS